MPSFTAGCVQLRSGKSVTENADVAEGLIRSAARDGATYVQTPEMSNVLVRSRRDLMERISTAEDDPFLTMARSLARDLEIHLHLGSLAVAAGQDKVANRAFLIGPDGHVMVSYDKIHMFDVDLPNGESWRESATYEPGTRTVVADLPYARMGLAICYDIRFPAVFRDQSRAGADVLTAPAAFTRQTGLVHWHVLQRARAIENGAYVISAAQGGVHEDGRETYGHSVVVDPWGAVVAELDHDAPGFVLADVDPAKAAEARQRIPAIANERAFTSSQHAASREMPA